LLQKSSPSLYFFFKHSSACFIDIYVIRCREYGTISDFAHVQIYFKKARPASWRDLDLNHASSIGRGSSPCHTAWCIHTHILNLVQPTPYSCRVYYSRVICTSLLEVIMNGCSLPDYSCSYHNAASGRRITRPADMYTCMTLEIRAIKKVRLTAVHVSLCDLYTFTDVDFENMYEN
jgi:hypothetical protein